MFRFWSLNSQVNSSQLLRPLTWCTVLSFVPTPRALHSQDIPCILPAFWLSTSVCSIFTPFLLPIWFAKYVPLSLSKFSCLFLSSNDCGLFLLICPLPPLCTVISGMLKCRSPAWPHITFSIFHTELRIFRDKCFSFWQPDGSWRGLRISNATWTGEKHFEIKRIFSKEHVKNTYFYDRCNLIYWSKLMTVMTRSSSASPHPNCGWTSTLVFQYLELGLGKLIG